MQSLKITLLSFCTLFLCQCGDNDSANAQTTAAASSIPTAEVPNFTLAIDGLGSAKVRLVGMYNDQQFIVDEATSTADGKVTFQRAEPYKQGTYFALFPDNVNFQIIIAEDQTFTVTGNLNDIPGSLQAEGSTANMLLFDNLRYEQKYQRAFANATAQINSLTEGTPEYEKLTAQRQELIDKRDVYLQRVFDQHPNDFFVKFKQAGQNPQLRTELDNDAQVTAYRMEFWDGVDFNDTRLLNTPVIHNKLQRYFGELTPQTPDSIIVSLERLVAKLPTLEESPFYQHFVNYVALTYEPTKTTLMDAEAVWVHMIKNHFTYERAFWSDSTNTYALQLRAEEMGQSLIGQDGPNVTAPGPDGKNYSIYDLEAPYIVVYLYNPDCEHCQEQSPVLVQLYNQWQQQTPPLVDVYAIAIDTEDQLWKDYIAKTGMRWTNVYDPSNRAIYKTYYVNITPEVYVLGPDRKIIAKNLNVNQINEVIQHDQAQR